MSEEPCGNVLLPRGLRTCAFLEEKGMDDAAPGRRVAASLLAPAMVPEQQCRREHPPLSIPMGLSPTCNTIPITLLLSYRVTREERAS